MDKAERVCMEPWCGGALLAIVFIWAFLFNPPGSTHGTRRTKARQRFLTQNRTVLSQRGRIWCETPSPKSPKPTPGTDLSVRAKRLGGKKPAVLSGKESHGGPVDLAQGDRIDPQNAVAPVPTRLTFFGLKRSSPKPSRPTGKAVALDPQQSDAYFKPWVYLCLPKRFFQGPRKPTGKW